MPMPGPSEWLIILAIFVLLFGARKLPELSRSVGQSITSFKKGIREADEEADEGEARAGGDPQAGDANPTSEQAGATRDETHRAGEGADGDRSQESRSHGNA